MSIQLKDNHAQVLIGYLIVSRKATVFKPNILFDTLITYGWVGALRVGKSGGGGKPVVSTVTCAEIS